MRRPRPPCGREPLPPDHLVRAVYDALKPRFTQAADTRLTCERSLHATGRMQPILDAVRSRDPEGFDRHVDDTYRWHQTSNSKLFTGVRNAFRLKAFTGHDVHVDGWTCRLHLTRFDIDDDSCLFSIRETQDPRHQAPGAWYQHVAQHLVQHTFHSFGILPRKRTCFYVVVAEGRDMNACCEADGYCSETPLRDDRGEPLGDGHIAVSDTIEPISHRVGVIAHELVHAVYGEAEDHGPRFRKAARLLGLEFLDHGPKTAACDSRLPDWVYEAHSAAGTPPDVRQPPNVRRRRGSRQFVRFETPARPVYIPALDDAPPVYADRDNPPV